MLEFTERGVKIAVSPRAIVSDADLREMVINVLDILEDDEQETFAYTTTGNAFVLAMRECGSDTIDVYVAEIKGHGYKSKPRSIAGLSSGQ